MANDQPHLSIVTPLYSSADSVDELVQRIEQALNDQNIDFEIIVVDDGSQDETWAHVVDLCTRHHQLRGIRLTRNFGQQAAIGVGLEVSRGGWVVTMDSDLQDDPKYIPFLLETARCGYDMVIAQWEPRRRSSMKDWTSFFFYKVFNSLTGVVMPRGTGTYRIMSRRCVDEFLNLRDRTEFFGGMMAWFGYPTGFVSVIRNERIHGSSGYTLRKRIGLGVSALVSFSTIPLRVAAVVGLAICALSLFLGLLIIGLRLGGTITQAGYAGIMVALLFMSGTILLSTGVLGIYLGSLIATSRQRPRAVVLTDTG